MARRAEILYGAGGEGLAISCVALGVSKQDFATLFLLSRSVGSGGQKTSPGDLARPTRLFDPATRENAPHVLRSWQPTPGSQPAGRDLEKSEEGSCRESGGRPVCTSRLAATSQTKPS